MIKIGDKVNIKNAGIGYWKGTVTEITKHDGVCAITPLYSINEINGKRRTLQYERDLRFKDGEYWEV